MMKRLKTVLDIAVTGLVVIAAALVIWRQFAPTGASPLRPRVEDAKGTISAEDATNARGTGAVALVEFADFECPFCGRHARDVDPAIRASFVDSGVLREVFLNYPLPNHPRAEPASEAALCAATQGRFWEMHDALFQSPASLQDPDLRERAEKVGLNPDLLAKCIEQGAARAVLTRHMRLANELGVQSTPVFFVGLVKGDGSLELKKRINGAAPLADFSAAITGLVAPELRNKIHKIALNWAQEPDSRRAVNQ